MLGRLEMDVDEYIAAYSDPEAMQSSVDMRAAIGI
jgi:hypothetical protein